MFIEFTNNELSTLAEQVKRSGPNDPLTRKLANFFAEASEIGGLRLVDVRLTVCIGVAP